MQKLIKEIQDKNIPVSDLLRKAKVLASKLDQEDFLDWVNLELAGYKDDSAYPDYRKLSGQIKAWNPYHGWQPVLFEKSKIEKTLTSRNTKQSVGEIEELFNSNTEVYEMPYPASAAAQILARSEIKTKVSLFLDRSVLAGVLNAVRNALLDWAIELEKQGVKGDEAQFTEEEKEKAQALESKYTIGSIENFHGNVGENNKQEERGGIIIPKESLLSKFFWYAVIALAVVIVGNIISALILNKFFYI